MENEFTEELLEKAKQTKTPEELAALAKENGQEMSDESAKAYFNLLHPVNGELADDELDDVSGGRNCGTIYKDGRPVITAINSCDRWRCETCGGVDADGLHCREHSGDGCCIGCKYSVYEDALLLCTHPERYEN